MIHILYRYIISLHEIFDGRIWKCRRLLEKRARGVRLLFGPLTSLKSLPRGEQAVAFNHQLIDS